MNREFLINILLLIGINVLIKPTYLFAIDARIQYVVGEEAYGLFFTLFNFSFLFQIINDAGIQNYNSHKVASDDTFIDAHLGRILGVKFLLGIAFLLSVLLGGLLMDYPSHYFYLLALITVNHFLATLFIYLRSTIAATGRYRTDTYISALDKLLMICILAYMLYGVGMTDTFRVEYLVYVQMVSYVIACLCAFTLLGKKIKASFSFSRDYTVKLIKAALPYGLTLLLMTIYSRMDSVMLERILLDNGFQSGIYARCYRIMEALNMTGYLFAALLLPMYARLLKEKASIASLSEMGLRLIIVIAFTAAISFVFYKKEILQTFYPNADEAHTNTLFYLLIGYVAISISYIYGTMMVANGTMKAINGIFFIGVVINLLANYFLIPSHLTVGAAMATAATQVFVMIGQVYLGHRRFNIPINSNLIARVVFWIGLCISSIYFIRQSLSYSWAIGMTLSILISAVFALLIGVVHKDIFISLLRDRQE